MKLKEEVARLNAINAEMMKSDDKQISLTDPKQSATNSSYFRPWTTRILGHSFNRCGELPTTFIGLQGLTNVIGWKLMSATVTAIQSKPSRQYSAADVELIDDYLNNAEQEQMYQFLRGPGWGYGASSHAGKDESRYWFKHFAGFWEVPTAGLDRHTQAERELSQYPLVEAMWQKVRGRSRLLRCYANGYPTGAEGGVHKDSIGADHYTLLYYPHMQWRSDWAGETLFFNERGDDVLCAVYPKPNRLVRFPGEIPHVARGISRMCPLLRITLMFKVSLAN